MKEIIEKLNKIKGEILSEKTSGLLRLFVLVERVDLQNKWDILLSADWIEKTNSEVDLVYFIDKLKSEFSGDLDFISRILLAKPQERFIQQVANAIYEKNNGQSGEISDLSVTSDLAISHLFVIGIDFTGINLTPNEGTDEGPVAVQDVSEF